MVTAARKKLDPVAERLVAAGEAQSAHVLEWLDGQHQRKLMRRRAVVCALGGWGLMTTAAIVSSLVALSMSNDMRQIVQGELIPNMGVPRAVIVLPWLLVSIVVVLVVGGLIGWLWGRIPGFSRTESAIDWSAASDAVTRLLSVGCTFPEAFRTAAAVTRSNPSRNWLIRAAERVESGGPQVMPTGNSDRDAAVLESMIQLTGSEPHQQWEVAANHFFDVACRRLVVLLQSTPMLATIISGLLIWVAISATLGWMWRAVASLIQGLT